MIEKSQQVDELLHKLKRIASKSLRKGRIKTCLAALSFAAESLYMFNQVYTDDDLESLTAQAGDMIKSKFGFSSYSKCQDTILVYDGFGLDTRGVVLMYLNALGMNGYKVCYVTDKKVRKSIPTIKKMCAKYNIDISYIDTTNYEKWCVQIARVFEEVKPRVAFFYTTPFDTAACAAFHIYEGVCRRYLIDLTDHAYWLGKCASDYFLGSREMSAYIQHYERNIPNEKCIKLGVNVYAESEKNHMGLPFDVEREKYIFSGGALYKTLGDPDNTYYKIIRHIMEKHENIMFLYAGTGDDRELKKIIADYPDRAFHINERKDFYYLIRNCVLYLNTYPMFGGMMMKYSALAHRLPVTLKHGSDSDGLLLHQKDCQIEYNSYNDLITDVDRLLDDDDYRKERERLLEGSVITETRFTNNIRGLIEKNKTDYAHEFMKMDTTKFRQEYYKRFDYKQNMLNIVKRNNVLLFWYFPVDFIVGVFKKIIIKKER